MGFLSLQVFAAKFVDKYIGRYEKCRLFLTFHDIELYIFFVENLLSESMISTQTSIFANRSTPNKNFFNESLGFLKSLIKICSCFGCRLPVKLD